MGAESHGHTVAILLLDCDDMDFRVVQRMSELPFA